MALPGRTDRALSYSDQYFIHAHVWSYKLHHDGLLAATKPFSLTKRVIVSCADMRLRRNTTTKFRAEIFRLGKIQAAVFARHAEVTSMAGPTESPGMRLFIARVCRINSRH
jgi:hypothetical protein